MNALDKLKLRTHWWVPYHGNQLETDAPATGGRVLPISAKTPAVINHTSTELVVTPIFETREDGEAFIAEFRARHPHIVDLWDKFGPVHMTTEQVIKCLLGEHCIPAQVYHSIFPDFIRAYANGYLTGKGPGPATKLAIDAMERLAPDPMVQ